MLNQQERPKDFLCSTGFAYSACIPNGLPMSGRAQFNNLEVLSRESDMQKILLYTVISVQEVMWLNAAMKNLGSLVSLKMDFPSVEADRKDRKEKQRFMDSLKHSLHHLKNLTTLELSADDLDINLRK